MKVDIADLRQRLNYIDQSNPTLAVSNAIGYEINEALNELESRRLASNELEALQEENRRLRNDFARLTEIKDRLIIAGNCMRDELIERTETTSFKKWFKNLHPETIESVTITLRKKEN